jgi:hypothetical protein
MVTQMEKNNKKKNNFIRKTSNITKVKRVKEGKHVKHNFYDPFASFAFFDLHVPNFFKTSYYPSQISKLGA